MRLPVLPNSRFVRGAFFFSVVATMLIAVGCAALAPPAQRPQEGLRAFEWHPNVLREHLRYFNSAEAEGRGTASRGFARAATYVGARMKQFGLQPGIHGDYRLVYQTPINYPVAASFTATGRDSIMFVPGVDFLPDARSDSGRISFFELVYFPDTRTDIQPAIATPAAMLPASHADDRSLEALRRAGYQVALLEGPLYPSTATAPIGGLMIQQVTPAVSEMLLGPLHERTPARPTLMQMRRAVRMRIVTDHQADAGAVNVLGFLGGKSPALRQELVMVCVDLDAIGTVAGVRTADMQNLGVYSAALLEVARNYGIVARRTGSPERTILFAVFSGSRLGNAGLRAYLQNPLWDLEKTVAVVYLGLPADREKSVRNLLGPFDIPVYAIPPVEGARPEGGLVVLPEASEIRRAGTRAEGQTSPVRSISDIMDESVLRAQVVAEQTHAILYPLTSGFTNRQYLPVTGIESAQ